MSITSSELVAYGALSRPTDDTSTSGGGIDTTVRPLFTQMAANAVIEVVSSGADTRTVTVVGRDAAGVVQTVVLALNGTAPVDSAQAFERLVSVTLSATSPTNTVTVKQGAAGATLAAIPPNEKGFYILFDNAASTDAPVSRYEKVFLKNTDGALALTTAQVTLTSDASGLLSVGLEAAVNDTSTVANRTTAPAGVAFSGTGTALNVPGGNLAAGDAIGVWVRQSLPANQVPGKSSFTLQLSGQTV